MRRVAVILVVGLGFLLALPAVAVGQAPAPGPTPSAPAGGKPVCTVNDSRLVELSGLGVTANGYVAVNDGSELSSRERIFFLDKSCKVSREVRFSGNGARDPEDLAVGKDGTVWVADTGDDPREAVRQNVALWKVAPNATTSTLYRLTFPAGEAHDAEALLLAADDTPIIVTKDPAGPSKLYVPTAALNPQRAVPMKLVGEFKPTRTGSPNTLGLIGQLSVTGGANSPDRSRVALRTYSDAYEWDVPDGDVVKAVTTGKPRTTPLPDDEFGEAIAYTADGAFLTVSETADLAGGVKPTIRQYTAAVAVEPTTAPAAGGGLQTNRNSLSWYEELSLRQVTMLVAAVGVLGLILVLIGVFGIRRARQRPAGAARTGDDQPTTLLAPVREEYGNSSGVYRSASGAAERDYDPGAYDGSYEDRYADGWYDGSAGGYEQGGHGPGGYEQGGYEQGGYGPGQGYDQGVDPRRGRQSGYPPHQR